MDKSIQTVIFYVMKTLKRYYQTRVDNLGPDTLKGDRLHIFNVHIILSMPFGGHGWVVVGGGVWNHSSSHTVIQEWTACNLPRNDTFELRKVSRPNGSTSKLRALISFCSVAGNNNTVMKHSWKHGRRKKAPIL